MTVWHFIIVIPHWTIINALCAPELLDVTVVKQLVEQAERLSPQCVQGSLKALHEFVPSSQSLSPQWWTLGAQTYNGQGFCLETTRQQTLQHPLPSAREADNGDELHSVCRHLDKVTQGVYSELSSRKHCMWNITVNYLVLNWQMVEFSNDNNNSIAHRLTSLS